MSRQRWASPSCSAASTAAPAARPAFTAASAARADRDRAALGVVQRDVAELPGHVEGDDRSAVHTGRGRLHQVEPGRHALGRDEQRARRERVGDRPDGAAELDRSRAGRAPSGHPGGCRERPAGHGRGRHRERGGQRAVGQLAQQPGGRRGRRGARGPIRSGSSRAGRGLRTERGGACGRRGSREPLAGRPGGGGHGARGVGFGPGGRGAAGRGEQRRGGDGGAAEVRDRGDGGAELLGRGGELAVGGTRAAQGLGDQQARPRRSPPRPPARA